MLLLPCPWCGPRNEDEFLNGGESGKHRPPDPASVSDEDWCDFVYVPANTKGWLVERWWHVAGCRRWFALARHTLTHAIDTTRPEAP